MKGRRVGVRLLGALIGVVVGLMVGRAIGAGLSKPFHVFLDRGNPDNHYIPSGWMGDWEDLTFDDTWTTDAHNGTCIKITYSAKAAQGNKWAGMYWQHPANNWGASATGGYDLTGATRLTFWARGEEGGEKIDTFKVGGISGLHPDSSMSQITSVALTKEWKQYAIPLEGKDLSHIIGAFCWSTGKDVNPRGLTMYLDDIQFE